MNRRLHFFIDTPFFGICTILICRVRIKLIMVRLTIFKFRWEFEICSKVLLFGTLFAYISSIFVRQIDVNLGILVLRRHSRHRSKKRYPYQNEYKVSLYRILFKWYLLQRSVVYFFIYCLWQTLFVIVFRPPFCWWRTPIINTEKCFEGCLEKNFLK